MDAVSALLPPSWLTDRGVRKCHAMSSLPAVLHARFARRMSVGEAARCLEMQCAAGWFSLGSGWEVRRMPVWLQGWDGVCGMIRRWQSGALGLVCWSADLVGGSQCGRIDGTGLVLSCSVGVGGGGFQARYHRCKRASRATSRTVMVPRTTRAKPETGLGWV